MKNILIIQPIDKSGIEILENHPDYNFEIIDGTDLEQIKEKSLQKARGGGIKGLG